jgi:hypothetical protein
VREVERKHYEAWGGPDTQTLSLDSVLKKKLSKLEQE